MKLGRLTSLERRAAAIHADAQQLITVHFANGTQRKMRIPDVIPLMLDGNHITGMDGDGGAGNGQLVALLRGLL